MEKMNDVKRQTLALLVDNEPGVLSQIARLFSRKGYNIEAFAAGPTENPGVTRITIDVLADEPHTELLCNQLRKLYPVHSVKRLNTGNSIYRELMLIKVKYTRDNRRDIIDNCAVMNATIIDMGNNMMTIQICDTPERSQIFLDSINHIKIVEITRSGTVALTKCKEGIK